MIGRVGGPRAVNLLALCEERIGDPYLTGDPSLYGLSSESNTKTQESRRR